MAHETHRSRILYNPWTTARMLERFENLEGYPFEPHYIEVDGG